MKKIFLTVLSLFSFFAAFSQIPTYTIGTVNTVNANGIADSLNVNCRVMGIVVGINFRGNNGLQFTIVDPIDGKGLGVFAPATANLNYTVTEGDMLAVMGPVAQFRGLTQINADSVRIISTENGLPNPVITAVLNESTESKLIRINGVSLVTPSQWPGPGVAPAGGANVDITNGTTTFTLRIDADCNLWGTPAPSGSFSLIGIGSQFGAATPPFNTGYQIMPRYKADIFGTLATSSVKFFSANDTINENAGAKNITVQVSPASTVATTLKLYVQNGTGVTYGSNQTYTTTPPVITDTITLNVLPNVGQTTFTINVKNDSIAGPNKTIVFNATTASNVPVGAPATLNFVIKDAGATGGTAPVYTICQVKGVNAQGVADSVGVRCELTGTVLGVNLRGTNGWQFTITNNNCGIGVFAPAIFNLGYTVNEGDNVKITGTLNQFRGLLQITPDSATGIVLLSANNPIPSPQVVTALDETTESKLIRINNLTLVTPSQWPISGTTGSGANVDVTDGSNTFTLRIDADVNIWGTTAPAGPFDLVGIGSQFNPTTSAPFLSGYQIMPRTLTDLILTQETLTPFNLLLPNDNERIEVSGAPTQQLNINWTRTFSSFSSPITYNWIVGFSAPIGAPIFNLPSNNNGNDSVISFQYRQLADLLGQNGVNVGDSLEFFWSVRATSSTGALADATTTRFLTVVRGVITSNTPLVPATFEVYPNPSSDFIKINNIPSQAYSLRILDINGKNVMTKTIYGTDVIDIQTLANGNYTLLLSNGKEAMQRQFIKK